MARIRVKICGVTRPEDAELAVGLGADYLGLNFFPQSPRFLEELRAREIATAVAGRARLVGVFVNAAREIVEKTASAVGLDLLQFHGDESADEIAGWGDRAVRALRLSGHPPSDLLSQWPGAWGFLVEGRHEALYGGSGESWRYEMICALSRDRPVFVAGGLRPGNVADAVRRSGAWGVDVCSGVEREPGIKDPELMRRFFEEVSRIHG
jgi:phosphoribosylanthranilate isomerase